MSKFVGKFRKNQNYNDDVDFESRKRNRKEHSEIRKMRKMKHNSESGESFEENERLPKIRWI